MRHLFAAAAVAAAYAIAATAAVADVEDRQKLMKSIGGEVKGISGYVKGENQETPADVVRRANAVGGHAGEIAGAFGDQIHVENAGGVETTASPAIWREWDAFVAAAGNLETAAGALSAAAEGGDKATITPAFAAMTKTCGACHEKFRVKKN